ncbi:MAG TPA: bifunctional phosphopantothenoylcysteine decarboxylase/phosphopantothenate--cysteine ligase CoaBC, partial [Desulfobacterales bacterium]|nr:bifunctional phosphopantothenoylcysteine decarboxylase/phosphopantothenate--cysteine ligase CoaBC [Desulfobacterales bacterium]
MQFDLSGKSILLGVTGSISAYKACDLTRLFVKAGADVHIVMSPSAARFVSPLTFEALTRNPVLTEGSESWSSELNHIDIGKQCDAFVIAPATANTINKLSKGIADNILLQTALAYGGKILVAPAANTRMLKNHYTVGSLKMLAVNDCAIIEPQEKLLACGEIGSGALAEPEEIFFRTVQSLFEDDFWKDRRIVVTGGGTREKIDEVRYLSNFSSGKMAKAVALALYSRGADVCYITSAGTEGLPADLYVIDVENSEELLNYTIDAIRVAKKGKMSKATMNSAEPVHLIQKEPYLFMAAAVSDYKPKFPQEGKLKKSLLGDEWQLELTRTDDILSSLNKEGIQTVAFKAEMDAQNGLENARGLLKEKGADAVCYNLLEDSRSFGTDENEITFITRSAELQLGRADKLSLALKILD